MYFQSHLPWIRTHLHSKIDLQSCPKPTTPHSVLGFFAHAFCSFWSVCLTFVSHENAYSFFSIWFWFFQPPWRPSPSFNPSLLFVSLSDFILMAYINASLPCYLMSSLNTGLYPLLFIFVFPTQDCPLFMWVWSTFLQFYTERQKKLMRGIPELLLLQQVNDLLLGLFPS